ncbi:hypothetical protein PRVXH_001561 [Proteinivorax hydrogeniformans]|uniref:Nicotianamine synthase protein n=1 Tax=Proteinivorax hydrogeniformans TaxID=1826727 RepID=A0AAU8HPU4_9FIRM
MGLSQFTQWCECKISSIAPARALYSFLYKKAVMEEIELAEVSESDNVLFIGGGAVPYTSIYIAEKCNKITVIDCNKCCVSKAQSLLKKLKVGNIEVKNVDGQDYDFSPYNVIFVPLQAEPKKEILKSIALTADREAKILIRAPKASCKCYTPIENIPAKLEKFKKLKQITFDKTFLCRAKDIKA